MSFIKVYLCACFSGHLSQMRLFIYWLIAAGVRDRSHNDLTTTTWTFCVIRNGLHGYQFNYSHLTTKTKWCIIIVVSGIHFYRHKSFRQVRTVSQQHFICMMYILLPKEDRLFLEVNKSQWKERRGTPILNEGKLAGLKETKVRNSEPPYGSTFRSLPVATFMTTWSHVC